MYIKKPRFLSCARGLVVNIVWFLTYARRGRQASHPYGQRLFSLPAPPRLAHEQSKITGIPFCANARKSRPKTPFLRVGEGLYIQENVYIFKNDIFFKMYIKKPLGFTMRKGTGEKQRRRSPGGSLFFEGEDIFTTKI